METTEMEGQETIIDVHTNVSTCSQNWETFLKDLNNCLPSIVNDFRGGRLKHFAQYWKGFTTDKWILESIEGCSIEFTEKPITK